MLTRRTLLESGLTVAALACTAGLHAQPRAMQGPGVRPIDALLVDDTITLPGPLAAWIDATGRALPVVAIRLDAATHDSLMRVLGRSDAIVGISSGATLFCLERIAWDHGFRLTARRQHLADGAGDNACRENVAALLSARKIPVASAPAAVRAYRPSRSDGMLHAWVMHKSASAPLRQGRREA